MTSKPPVKPALDEKKTVYQVRAIDVYGNKRIVHSYETEDGARNAIEIMKKKTKMRYDIVTITNQPHMHWGINPPYVKKK